MSEARAGVDAIEARMGLNNPEGFWHSPIGQEMAALLDRVRALEAAVDVARIHALNQGSRAGAEYFARALRGGAPPAETDP